MSSKGILCSRITSEALTRKELVLGYFLGPFSVMLMNSILTNYLNVYYTDVMDLGYLWGGMFLTLFPLVVKAMDAFTYIVMGNVLDRSNFVQGKARPWILISAPLLVISMVLLFLVPTVNDGVLIAWIFVSYNLFYSVAYTIYNTAHVLMVPLATNDSAERGRLSVVVNCQGMLAGSIVAVLFPTFIVPAMGVNRSLWMVVMTCVAIGLFPFILLEYYYTRERVTEAERAAAEAAPAQDATVEARQTKASFLAQVRKCMRSRTWTVFMCYLIVNNLVMNLASNSVFYYCNWVLGSYNDGYTQMLFYAVGNAPLGLGIFLCQPLARRLGRKRSIQLGYLMAAVGIGICLWNPYSLACVLIGQVVKSTGLIPATFLTSTLLADALDDVEAVTGERIDGVSAAVYNVIGTISVGLALCILNLGLTQLGYQAPATGAIPVQNGAVQNFLVVIAIGAQVVVYPLLAFMFRFFKMDDAVVRRPQETYEY